MDDVTGDSTVERRSRALFDEQVANLDAHTRSRLNRARQAALAAASGQARRPAWSSRWLLPVGSAAAVTLVALSAVQLLRTDREAMPSSEPVTVASTVDDVEILTSSEELDMLQNVDFYAWLDTQQDGQSGSGAADHSSAAG
jgi:hypothetical protein